jgi:aspartyl-tRNA(Asn)/glutamyl-tRNA(Gln) amidotransferase subunit A
MTVSEIGRLLRTGKISCTQLIEQTLAHIREYDVFHSIITLMEEAAMRAAAEREKELADGIDRGPFHGIPIAHKDNYYTQGVRTTAGSLIFRDFVPSYDATVVDKLRTAGAICVAKTNLHELAFGITSKNPHYGFVLNPLDTQRIAGGSSGGSAALVASNLLPMCTGSDTGGSIRVPASYCGIVGFKPTYGRVSRRGLLPLSFSLDCPGPLASCVEDCALAMNAMAGPDPLDPSCAVALPSDFNLPALRNLSGIRVGVPRKAYFNRLQEDVAVSIDKALGAMEQLGASLIEVLTPNLDEMNAVARIVQMAETAAIYADSRNAAEFGADVWALIEQGRRLAAHEYVNAQRIRTLFRRDFDALWQQIDLLVTPTTPITAPLITEDLVQIGSESEDTRLATTRLVRSINLLGEPALSLPCGKAANGMPIGLQLISPPLTEPWLLQIGKTLEGHLL